MLDELHEVARLCGDVALRHFRKNVAVERKQDGSEVTIADREAEGAVRDWISERYPHDAILGEELGSETGPGQRRWIIDPIDGTRSFIRGVPLWGSLIAVEEHGEVTGGAINCPATGDLIVAVRGAGCWHNGVRCFVSATNDISQATILTTEPHLSSSSPRRAERWAALVARAGLHRGWSDCYGYALVATGRAELMVDGRMSPWDVAALIPVIEEAGGVFTDWRGRRGIGPDAIASNAALATEFRELLGVPESQ